MPRLCFVLVFLFSGWVFPVASADNQSLTAEEVIPYLIGHWRFAYGERTGGRIYTALYEEQSAEIQEYFDNLPYLGKGIVQRSPDGNFSYTLFFNTGENDFLSGRFDPETQTITYRSARPEFEKLRFVFEIVDQDHFRYTNFKIENETETKIFSAEFTRLKAE